MSESYTHAQYVEMWARAPQGVRSFVVHLLEQEASRLRKEGAGQDFSIAITMLRATAGAVEMEKSLGGASTGIASGMISGMASTMSGPSPMHALAEYLDVAIEILMAVDETPAAEVPSGNDPA